MADEEAVFHDLLGESLELSGVGLGLEEVALGQGDKFAFLDFSGGHSFGKGFQVFVVFEAVAEAFEADGGPEGIITGVGQEVRGMFFGVPEGWRGVKQFLPGGGPVVHPGIDHAVELMEPAEPRNSAGFNGMDAGAQCGESGIVDEEPGLYGRKECGGFGFGAGVDGNFSDTDGTFGHRALEEQAEAFEGVGKPEFSERLAGGVGAR